MTKPPLLAASLACLERLRNFYHLNPSAHMHGNTWDNLVVKRRSSVLVVLFLGKLGELRVLLTVRSRKLRSFPGHVAFPGGKSDSLEETPWDIARREAFEEIGLPRYNDELPKGISLEHLTIFPPYLSRNFLATYPCIAFLDIKENKFDNNLDGLSELKDILKFNLNPMETSSLFSAPLIQFLYGKVDLSEYINDNDNKNKNKNITKYKGGKVKWAELPWVIHNFQVTTRQPDEADWLADVSDLSSEETDPKTGEADRHSSVSKNVWGLTANMLVDISRIAYDEEPRVSHYREEIGDETLISELIYKGQMKPERSEWELGMNTGIKKWKDVISDQIEVALRQGVIKGGKPQI